MGDREDSGGVTINPKDYFRRYLAVAPIALAIYRSIEAKNFSQVKFKKPLLDIGCGFGEFAGVFFESNVEMGVDINYKELIEAIRKGKYTSLTRADARNLPFKNETFSSIISVSTLEHIERPEEVLKEAFRVLKPNGVLAITVVTNKISDYIFYAPLLKKIGLVKLGELYANLYNQIFHHRTLISKETWLAFVKDAGFVVEESREIISPQATKLFDQLLILAWPSQLYKVIFGRRIAFRPKFMLNLLVNAFSKYTEEESEEGSNLFILARKPKK